jgi:hypothetical protein
MLYNSPLIRFSGVILNRGFSRSDSRPIPFYRRGAKRHLELTHWILTEIVTANNLIIATNEIAGQPLEPEIPGAEEFFERFMVVIIESFNF